MVVKALKVPRLPKKELKEKSLKMSGRKKTTHGQRLTKSL